MAKSIEEMSKRDPLWKEGVGDVLLLDAKNPNAILFGRAGKGYVPDRNQNILIPGEADTEDNNTPVMNEE